MAYSRLSGQAKALRLTILSEFVARSVFDTLNVTTACRWRSQTFRLTKKKASGTLQKTSSRTDHLIVLVVRADSTLSLTELARVVHCSVSPSMVRGELLGLNLQSVKRPKAVELTDGFTTVTRVRSTICCLRQKRSHVVEFFSFPQSSCYSLTQKCKFRRWSVFFNRTI